LLASVSRFYGSGVYALYYNGAHPAYQRIRRTETPIYVGKADPQSSEADTARQQGDRLSGRLRDHSKSIVIAQNYAETNNLPNPLRIEDFEYRQLVVASNAQMAAERHLINIFKPVWNDDFKICWGISKHGDAATTRANKRSPWDTLHPGRLWALAETLVDKKPQSQILEDISRHLKQHTPIKNRRELVERFLNEFIQAPPSDSSDDVALNIGAEEELGDSEEG